MQGFPGSLTEIKFSEQGYSHLQWQQRIFSDTIWKPAGILFENTLDIYAFDQNSCSFMLLDIVFHFTKKMHFLPTFLTLDSWVDLYSGNKTFNSFTE